ncbi:MAG TPA: class I SAM-dependent methyltransferase [Gemmatimonadales bacterium]|nr:class I SAM-dependent methyltransferase [Gemmatimonadales bacterium]
MLTAQDLLSTAPRRQSLRSLRQQYDLYVMDRIEHYKNSLSREELLRIGDDAFAGLGEESQQYLLTDVLMQGAVDDLIRKRLGIRSYDTWRKQFPKLRATQRDPVHWGIDPAHLSAGLAPRIEPDDKVLLVGSGAMASAYLFAAHDADVTFLGQDFGVIERAEQTVASEALSSTFDAIFVQLGVWLPPLDGDFDLVVLDTGTIASLSPGDRRFLLAELQGITQPGGMHALIPDGLGTGSEGFAGHYAAWQREPLPPAGRRPRGAASRGAIFMRPIRDAVAVEDSHDASA